MGSILKLKDKYRIVFKNYFFNKEFFITPFSDEFQPITDNEYKEKSRKKFDIYGLNISDIEGCEFCTFPREHYLLAFNLCFHKVLFKEGGSSLIVEIIDVAVKPEYRSKGIGSQLLAILEEIVLENKIKFIVGELQDDHKNQPLQKRKIFFESNGFKVWGDERSSFSGWIIKKCLE